MKALPLHRIERKLALAPKLITTKENCVTTTKFLLLRLQRTALMLAVSGNHPQCVVTLLKSGAEPNLADDGGHSALFRAVTLGQHDTVRLLLAEGAKVGLRDVNGKTVLHLAAACGNFECLKAVYAKMLPEEVTLLDNNGCSVLHWACYTGMCVVTRKN